jgi:hypothetical protein
VVFKTSHEKVKNGLIGGSLMLSQVNKKHGMGLCSESRKTLQRRKWSRSGDEEELTVFRPKSQLSLLLNRRLLEGKRTSKVERMESANKKLAEVPLTALQNNLVVMAAERAREIQETVADGLSTS